MEKDVIFGYMRHSCLLFLIMAFSFSSCRDKKQETIVPESVLGLHECNTGIVIDASGLSDGRVLALSLGTGFEGVTGMNASGTLWFSNTFRSSNVDDLKKLLHAPDNGVILLGNEISQNPQPVLVHVDKNGNVAWKVLSDVLFGIPGSVIRTHDDNYFTVISKYDNGQQYRHLIWSDAAGNRTRSAIVTDTGSITQVIEAGDNGFLLIGRIENNINQNIGVVIRKISPEGIRLWSKSIFSDRNIISARALLLPGDELMIFGDNANDQFSSVGRAAYIMKVSSSGDLLWNRAFYSNGGACELADMIADGKGGYLAAGAGANMAQTTYNIMLLSIDANGNEQWRKVYDDIGGFAKAIFKRPDGGYNIMGNRDTESTFFMLITDNDGNIE